VADVERVPQCEFRTERRRIVSQVAHRSIAPAKDARHRTSTARQPVVAMQADNLRREKESVLSSVGRFSQHGQRPACLGYAVLRPHAALPGTQSRRLRRRRHRLSTPTGGPRPTAHWTVNATRRDAVCVELLDMALSPSLGDSRTMTSYTIAGRYPRSTVVPINIGHAPRDLLDEGTDDTWVRRARTTTARRHQVSWTFA